MKNQQPPELRLHSVEKERWTWCYVEPATGIELFSNDTYATREGAADYARRAYPDVPLADDEEG